MTCLTDSLFYTLYRKLGPLAALLSNRFGYRVVMIGGSLLASAGFLLSSLVTSVDALFVTIGLMGGLGFGLIYLGSSVAVSLYMNEKRVMDVVNLQL